MKKKRIVWTSAALLLAAGVLWTAWGDVAVEVHRFSVSSKRLPAPFRGFRIAQISDFHNTLLDDGNRRTLTLLRDSTPDIIVVTGDLIDSRDTKVGIAADFMREAAKIAPVYYVTGNHESRVPEAFQTLLQSLEEIGVHVLRDTAVTLERDGAQIRLIGMDDPGFSAETETAAYGDTRMQQKIKALMEAETYTVLLAHHPERIEDYAAAGVDLAFTGHAHGGQFRLPFIGGLLAPGQGLFPQYDSGLYRRGETQMLVSRGLGNSLFPFRLNNRPEIVLAEFT